MLNHALLGVAVGGGCQMENSLLFRGAQYLTRTPASAGAIKSATFNVWLRLSDIATAQCLFFAGTDINNREYAYFEGSSGGYTLTWGCFATGVRQWWWHGAAKFRDPTGFVMLTFVRDLDNVSAAGRLRVYLNGQLLTADSGTTVYPETTVSRWWGAATPHAVGCQTFNSVWYFRGILSEPAFVDGAALSPDVFGQIDPVTGSWRPKRVSGVDFGTNGFYLGRPWNTDGLGADASGRGNDWTPVGFAASDVVGDSPTNVFATLNALTPQSIGTDYACYGNGNTALTNTSAAGYAVTLGTIAFPNSGKWAFRVDKPPTGAPGAGFAGTYWFAGIVKLSLAGRRAGVDGLIWGGGQAAYCGVSDNGCVCNFGAGLTNQAVTSGAVTFEFLFDFDGNTVTVKRDGTNYYSGAITNPGEFAIPFIYAYDTGTTTARFGGFAPSVAGYKNICTANLAATTGATSGTFIGNVNADGPCVFTGAVPETLSVNGNAVIWGTHADRLATGFKIRTASLAYNASGANSWAATYDKKPTVGPKGRAPANAQSN
ncbi:LamG-like jellyroll fold domain-containing protein [Magnetospirillum aberrantis]|uniref:Uncharacterized protein n=1 Tax=Magnetospirillum aberrantis SpK TaxID=908842 RepID=A0A7C9UZU9_9PROT|nr:LamG-like jellyroll fold domain-containing protein [Magnetospirillum aberrantis]NFV80793.1 hypothetical protein [Magnetospirillum aberrantis SpK]